MKQSLFHLICLRWQQDPQILWVFVQGTHPCVTFHRHPHSYSRILPLNPWEKFMLQRTSGMLYQSTVYLMRIHRIMSAIWKTLKTTLYHALVVTKSDFLDLIVLINEFTLVLTVKNLYLRNTMLSAIQHMKLFSNHLIPLLSLSCAW